MLSVLTIRYVQQIFGFIAFDEIRPGDAALLADIFSAADEAICSPLNSLHSAANDEDRCDPAREIANLKHQAWQFAQDRNLSNANLQGAWSFKSVDGWTALYFSHDEVGALA